MELQDNGQYLITVEEILANSEITNEDLTDLYGDKIDSNLVNVMRKTYSIMYKAYRGIYRERQRLALNYMIQQDEDKQNAIRDAQIEYIRGASISGMDLLQYENNSKYYSESIIDILRENGLYILATIVYQDEELDA